MTPPRRLVLAPSLTTDQVKLGPRHLRVVVGVLKGHTLKRIADDPSLSRKTVDYYIDTIARALPAKFEPEAARMRRIMLAFQQVDAVVEAATGDEALALEAELAGEGERSAA